MKIELRNILVSEHLSEETNAFTAKIYINDVFAGYALNHGTGGVTDYHPANEQGKQLIRQAEVYCGKLPPEHFSVAGENYTLDMNLEHFIDSLLQKHLHEKDIQAFRKKAKKAMEQTIVIGVPDRSYHTLGIKFPVELLLAHPNGKDILKDILIKQVIPNLKEGEVVLNTNLHENILKEAGLTDKQYVPQKTQDFTKKTPQKKKGRSI